jgi:hypothetical protein
VPAAGRGAGRGRAPPVLAGQPGAPRRRGRVVRLAGVWPVGVGGGSRSRQVPTLLQRWSRRGETGRRSSLNSFCLPGGLDLFAECACDTSARTQPCAATARRHASGDHRRNRAPHRTGVALVGQLRPSLPALRAHLDADDPRTSPPARSTSRRAEALGLDDCPARGGETTVRPGRLVGLIVGQPAGHLDHNRGRRVANLQRAARVRAGFGAGSGHITHVGITS